MTPMPESSDRIPRPWETRLARLHPNAYLYVHAVLGIAGVGALLKLFLSIAEDIPEQGALVRFDDAAAGWLQRHGTEGGEAIFNAVSWLGASVLALVLLAVVVVMVRRRDWVAALAIASAGGGGALLNYALKMVFHRGRPEYAAEFITHATWSFPSGHAMESLAGYGFLAFVALQHVHSPVRRRAIVASVVMLVAIIGYSRVYLGVHYVSDVIGGYLAGAAWLLVCVTGYRFARARRPATRPET
jgi:membrane-associated phospholipid phosphatase